MPQTTRREVLAALAALHQSPGAFERMQHGACTHLLGVHLINGAGHSLAEEQPGQVNGLLLDFLRRATAAANP
jgi:pimeloyl-ACP methyl ester carboxylesterase